MVNDQELEQGLRNAKILWATLISSLAAYVVLAQMVGEKINVSLPAQTFTTLRTVLYVVSLCTIIGSRILRSKMLASANQPTRSLTATDTTPVVRRYISAMVISLGLAEAVALYGVILYVLGKNQVDLYALILAAVTAMLLHAPKRSELLDLAQNSGARL